MPLWFTLSCKRMSKGNALEMANYFYETGNFAYAEPDLMIDNILNCATDPLFNNQWGLNNTGQNGGTSGIDMNVCNAWNITEGSNSIKVAVVDDGIQMTHPDLQANVFGTGYDTENGTPSSVLRGNHGTSVAGIIAAAKNNGYGIAGVAPSCKLISVSTSPYSNTNARKKKAEGINWAWQNGADVINCSWGWDPNLSFQVIDDAISNALTQGRGGKGCIVVFAVGNDGNSNVNYPANSNTKILAIGAATYCGERKSSSSCDNNNGWGSNYGNSLDIMAPGIQITTIDRTGINGYDSGDYTSTFGGTSAAAPFVAGVAALMLSANPNLTVEQVNEIIEFTAQKVREEDLYSYTTTSGKPNGSWNEQMGYGLIDAGAAVCMAKNYATFSGPSTLCNSNRTYTINNQAGTTVSWSVSPTSLFAVDSGTGSSFTTRATNSYSSGEGAIIATVSGSCGSYKISKEVWVGRPVSIGGILSGPSSASVGQLVTYTHYNATTPNGGTYDWTLPYDYKFCTNCWSVFSGGNGNNQVRAIAGSSSGYMQVRKTNACGSGGAKLIYVTVSGGGGGGIILQSTPNPANTELNINLTNVFAGHKNETAVVLLYDKSMNTVFSTQTNQKELVIPTAGLPNGNYILQIVLLDKVYQRHIMLKH